MKKIFSLIVLVVILSGCSESFLDTQPEDTLAPGIYFNSITDIKTGVVGVYASLPNIFAVGGLPFILGQLSDEGGQALGFTVWHSFYKTNANSASGYWDLLYKMIVNANNIIDIIDKHVPKTDADAIVLKAYRGEACFLRALGYFYLVRIYGDVPMVVNHFSDPGKAFGIGRTPVDKIYKEVIIPDLEYAFANCYIKGDPAISTEGARATKGAALTILAKVYLTMKDHSKAAATLKKLIVDKEGGNYSLLTDYSKIWLPSNKFSSESIFEIDYNVAAGTPSYFYRNMAGIVGTNVYRMSTCNDSFVGEKNLMDEYVAFQEWTRYKVSVDSSLDPKNLILCPCPLKLMPPLSAIAPYDKIGTDYNYMVTRYADALLMYAEALMVLGQKDEAAGYVNQVRGRVKMAPITASDLNIDRILHERRMELAFEGHRYFDLVRTDKAIEYISRDLMSAGNDYGGRLYRTEPIPEYQLILPIPVGEIEKDQTLTQNPGY